MTPKTVTIAVALALGGILLGMPGPLDSALVVVERDAGAA